MDCRLRTALKAQMAELIDTLENPPLAVWSGDWSAEKELRESIAWRAQIEREAAAIRFVLGGGIAGRRVARLHCGLRARIYAAETTFFYESGRPVRGSV